MEQQRAAEAAGHEYLEDNKIVDGVSKINEEHFEMATSESRMSVAQARHHPGRDRRAGDGGGENLYAYRRSCLERD